MFPRMSPLFSGHLRSIRCSTVVNVAVTCPKWEKGQAGACPSVAAGRVVVSWPELNVLAATIGWRAAAGPFFRKPPSGAVCWAFGVLNAARPRARLLSVRPSVFPVPSSYFRLQLPDARLGGLGASFCVGPGLVRFIESPEVAPGYGLPPPQLPIIPAWVQVQHVAVSMKVVGAHLQDLGGLVGGFHQPVAGQWCAVMPAAGGVKPPVFGMPKAA